VEAFLVERALARAGAPMLDAGNLQHAGPLLMSLADEPLCRRFLPAMACGQVRWAVHGSLLGAAPVEGRALSGGIELQTQRTLLNGACRATAVALLVESPTERALAVAELLETAITPNQPLDPDTVDLTALRFEVLATTGTHPNLASALAALRVVRTGCWSGRLRRQLERLGAEDPAAESELAALAVSLAGLEAMEQRAVFTADDGLSEAVAIRAAELGRQLAERWVEQLGYYALPAPDPTRQHNELPAQALAAQDAMAELIRYLDGDLWTRRDVLARGLGIAAKPGALR
jgi:hypothetical protein